MIRLLIMVLLLFNEGTLPTKKRNTIDNDLNVTLFEVHQGRLVKTDWDVAGHKLNFS